MKKYLVLVFLFAIVQLYSQNTLKFDASKKSPKAKINDVSWISGHWVGEAFGGVTEEVWTSPLGESMMGSFKLVVNEKVQFYEICTISEENETLVFRLKHFHNDLKGWEEKDERPEAQLVKVEHHKVYFNDFTFERINEREFVI